MFKKFSMILFLLFLFLSGCKKIDKTPPYIEVNSDFETTYEVYSHEPNWLQAVTASDVVDGKIIITEDMVDITNVDMNTVGSFDVIYEVENLRGIKSAKTLTIEIVDTIEPVFEGLQNLTLEVGANEPDWLSGVTVNDNYDGDIILTLDNIDTKDLDMNTPGTYEVVYRVIDENNNEAEETIIITIVCSVIPIIHLIGEEELTLFIGDTYEELGALAMVEEKDISEQINIGGFVDVNTVGDYVLTYDVSYYGNDAIQVTRTIHVINDILYLIEDAHLKDCIRSALDKTDGPVTLEEAQMITYLDASSCNITDLSGIQQLTNLSELKLTNNNISDITPLMLLTHLQLVMLNLNQIDLSDGSDNRDVIEYFIDHSIDCDLSGKFIDDDHSDDKNDASIIQLNSNHLSEIDYRFDIDYFVLTVYKETTVKLYTTGTIDTTGSLLDINENLLSIDFDSGAGFNFFIEEVLQSGTYYLVINGNENTTGSYELYIEEIETNREINFLDKYLEEAIRDELNINEGPIYSDDVKNITELHLEDKKITNLTGLEYFEGLILLRLSDNHIRDITPISNLTHLTQVWLDNNKIDDISTLNNLINLEFINLNHNKISDITIMSDLTTLHTIWIDYNNISDLTPLYHLDNLEVLSLNGNNISDLSPLSNLSNLYKLHLSHNNIVDVSPLANLSNLEDLNLNINNIEDISSLNKLTNLISINLAGNQLTNINVLTTLYDGGAFNGIDWSYGYHVNLDGNLSLDISESTDAHNVITYLSQNDVTINDIDEYCDHSSGAFPIIIDSINNGNLIDSYDEDWFILTIEQGTFVHLYSVSSTDIYIILYDYDLNHITRDVNGENFDLLLYLEAGTYYIDIYGYTDSNNEPYELNIEEIECGAPLIFPDTHLEEGIRYNLDVYNRPIYAHDIINVTDLWLDGFDISDLSGLEVFSDLTYLSLHDNNLSDVTPISSLTQLEILDLSHNHISDISVLSQLTNINTLYIEYNTISDLSPLSNLTLLVALDLSHNAITDVNALSGLNNLQYLNLSTNQITDISVLRHLNQLCTINLSNNLLTNINVLSTLYDAGAFRDFYWYGENNIYINGNPLLDISMNSEAYTILVYLYHQGALLDYEIPDDHGDASTDATTIDFTDMIDGHLEVYDDEDWFVFTLIEGTNVHLYTTGSIDTYGVLYDSDLNELASNDINFDLSLYLHAGTYYLKINCTKEDIGPYRLYFEEIVLTEVIFNDINFENAVRAQLNIYDRPIFTNDIEGMTQLAISENYNIIDITGIEYFTDLTQLQITSNQIVDITPITSLPNITNLWLHSNLITDISPLMNISYLETVALFNNPLEIIEGNNNYITIQYFIDSDIVSDLNGKLIDDDISDWKEEAVIMSVDDTTTGNINFSWDYDYFKLTLNSPMHLFIYTTGSTNTVGMLYNEDMEILIIDKNSGSGNNCQISYALQEGTYYLSISGETTLSSGQYELNIEAYPDIGGQSFDTGFSVNLDSSIEASIEFIQDVDYFVFTLEEQQTIEIYSTGTTDTVARMYNSSFTQIGYNDERSYMDSNFYFCKTLIPGTYYVEVAHFFDDDTGDYVFHIITSQ